MSETSAAATVVSGTKVDNIFCAVAIAATRSSFKAAAASEFLKRLRKKSNFEHESFVALAHFSVALSCGQTVFVHGWQELLRGQIVVECKSLLPLDKALGRGKIKLCP